LGAGGVGLIRERLGIASAGALLELGSEGKTDGGGIGKVPSSFTIPRVVESIGRRKCATNAAMHAAHPSDRRAARPKLGA
jgi:hypothetical protein